MSIIPLKQEIVVVKSFGLDEWGRKITSPNSRITMKARVQENDKVKQSSGSANHVHQVIAQGDKDSVKIYVHGVVDISTEDKIEYTDELGRLHVYEPERIEVRRWLSGKALFTIIYA